MATASGLLVCEGPARESGFCFGRRQQHRDPSRSQSARLNGLPARENVKRGPATLTRIARLQLGLVAVRSAFHLPLNE